MGHLNYLEYFGFLQNNRKMETLDNNMLQVVFSNLSACVENGRTFFFSPAFDRVWYIQLQLSVTFGDFSSRFAAHFIIGNQCFSQCHVISHEMRNLRRKQRKTPSFQLKSRSETTGHRLRIALNRDFVWSRDYFCRRAVR